MKKIAIFAIACLSTGISVNAGEPLDIKFHSRALLDATISGYGKENTQGYYRLEDFRIGFKATCGAYELKADIGFGESKVKVKDLLLNYHFKHGTLSLGNAYDPYSVDMLTSTADMRFHQSAGAVLAFTDGRKVGATYYYSTPTLYLATGLYTHNDINTIGDSQENAMVSTTRAVWRKRWKGEKLLHVGGAFSFRTRPVNTADTPETAISNEGVTSMFPHPLMEADIDHIGTVLKGLFEVLYLHPRFMVQGEYFMNRFNRTYVAAYRPQGGYIQAGVLLQGRGFKYDAMYAIPGRPRSRRAVELVARYNYTGLNDCRAGIMDGQESDLSLGINLYLNEYIGIKLNGSYVFVGNHCDEFYKRDIKIVQLRLQYIM